MMFRGSCTQGTSHESLFLNFRVYKGGRGAWWSHMHVPTVVYRPVKPPCPWMTELTNRNERVASRSGRVTTTSWKKPLGPSELLGRFSCCRLIAFYFLLPLPLTVIKDLSFLLSYLSKCCHYALDLGLLRNVTTQRRRHLSIGLLVRGRFGFGDWVTCDEQSEAFISEFSWIRTRVGRRYERNEDTSTKRIRYRLEVSATFLLSSTKD